MSSAPEIAFKPGDLVRARDREWVVMPGTTASLLMVRPLGGLDDEIAGILTSVERVEPASFAAPEPEHLGDHNACRLLRDAARLSTRAASGPFRAFGRIAVEPRPYQLVPLMMALRHEIVRLLIADDVGIGKTVEACLIAKELLERGEADGLCVLCPPHLCEQWQRELREKFHLEAEIVTPSTIRRLERNQRHTGESIFTRHRLTIVSIDYIKADRRVDDFVTHCPNLVIVDEAHACTVGEKASRGRQQRHRVVQALATRDTPTHLVLVTATPHSGNDEAFESLVQLLDPSITLADEHASSAERDRVKQRLARHLVQRKRSHVSDWLGNTAFPTPFDAELGFRISGEYEKFLTEVIRFARGVFIKEGGSRRDERIRWWSFLSLLRAVASSPAAAAATFRNRAATADASTEQEVDERGAEATLDLDDSTREEAPDFTPGSDVGDLIDASTRRRFEAFADQANALRGKHDSKLASLVAELKKLLKDGFSPIVFCRFIDTAEYVAEELRDAFKKVEVAAVTGHLAAADRESRIAELAKAEKRILVCTDCLSEGVNLQEHFDAVVHYDLSWNPTRHEQREGRVDRFGQERDEVRLLTMHGENNFIDVLVLNVLLRKHKEIRRRLDVSVAVPRSASDVVARLYDEVRSKIDAITERQLLLDFATYSGEEELHTEWEARAERASRSIFAQATISPQEVQAELELVRQSIGDAPTVERFLRDVFSQLNVQVFSNGPRLEVAISSEAPRSLRNAIDRDAPFAGRVELPVKRGELHLARTHPIVEGLASWVLDTALDPRGLRDRDPLAARCGVSRIAGLEARVVVLLLRLRHHLLVGGRRDRTPMLAEEILPVGFTGPANAPQWLAAASVESALAQPPAANVLRSVALDAVKDALAALPTMQPALEAIAADRAESLRASHLRVRQSSKAAGTVTVEPVLPVDVLGVFVLLPHRTT